MGTRNLARGIFLHAALALGVAGCQPGVRDAPEPFVIPSSVASPELAFASESGEWARRVAGLEGLGARRVVTVPSVSRDASLRSWTTDAWVFGHQGGRIAVLEMPGERGLSDWARRHFQARGRRRIQVGQPREFPERRFDAGGNVLVSPPVPGRFPYGRIVTSAQVQPALKEFLRAQRVQAGPDSQLIELDTGWLKVGHVDEIVAFVPLAEGGFRLVLPDAEAGLKLLASVPPDRAVFAAQNGAQVTGQVTAAGARFLEDSSRDFGQGQWKYLRIISGRGAGLVAHVSRAEGTRLVIDRTWDLRGESPTAAVRAAREARPETMPVWFDVPDETSRYVAVGDSRMWLDGAGEEFPALVTAGELLGDPLLALAASECAKRIFGPGGVRTVVTRSLGLTEDEAVLLPVLFCSDGGGGAVAALAPNPANLVCCDREVVLLKPFGPRESPADESTDVFLRAWTLALRRCGARPVFLDGWDSLHRLDGGARCGTNVLRKP